MATTTSAQVLGDTNLLFVSDVTQCNAASVERAKAVRARVGVSGIPILMTEANNCTDVSSPYDSVDEIWGTARDRLLATPGNHDYYTGIDHFREYFGQVGAVIEQGVPNPNWTIIRLNTNYPGSGGKVETMTDSEWSWQKIGLRTVLGSVSTRTKCVLVYGHHPRYTSGPHQSDSGMREKMKEIWSILDEFGVELYISGHDHHYERMKPMNASSEVVANGVVQIVAGTGGASLTNPASGTATKHRNSDAIVAQVNGLLELKLMDNSFRTVFVDTAGKPYDSYTAECH